MALTPQQIADKWSRNLSSAGESIKQGVDAVTESPTEKAARRVDAYVAGVQRAAANGKWQRGLRNVSIDDWKEAMRTKAVNRITSGAAIAKPKMEAFMSRFMPFVEAAKRELDQSMPRGSFEENKARMNAMIDKLHQFGQTGAG